MPVDPVSSSVGSVNKASDTATSTAKSTTKKPVKKLQKTTKPVTSDPDLPGGFPSEETARKNDQSPPSVNFGGIWTAIKQWFASFVPWAFDWFEMICCGVPLLVFLLGVFLFAIIAVLLWVVLALLILGPVLLVASMMGVSLWGWGWVFYGLVKFLDRKFLGGVIMRSWAIKQQTDVGQDEGEAEETTVEEEGGKKEQ